ncbi:unknown [Clostridium sp. CAG:628]|nr:unknown [Clostridium sp. CAG:628]
MNKKIIFLLISISIFLVSFITIKYFENKCSYVTYYILQEGAFKNYNGVIKTTRNYNNYVISKEDELYKIYIGVTLDKEVYNKLISMYSKTSSTYMKKVNINNKEFYNKVRTYDNLIKNSDNLKEVDLIVKEELKLLKKILD